MPIDVVELKYIYSPGTAFEHTALDGVTLNIADGEFVGLIGHTGSGKSTLIQHLNGLLKPTSGNVSVNGVNTDKTTPQSKASRGPRKTTPRSEASRGPRRKAGLKELRREVGLVFQYPEYQLFEDTVEKDIAFGPKNMGLSEEEVSERVHEAMDMVRLDYDEFGEKSPFELSGGQKRLVAIAGVIAMRPKALILDEPIAGIDPKGRRRIMELIERQHSIGRTIIMVSHNMDDVARFAGRIVVLNDGKIVLDGTPESVFGHAAELIEMGLDVPQAVRVAAGLRERGVNVPDGIFTIEALSEYIIGAVREKAHV